MMRARWRHVKLARPAVRRLADNAVEFVPAPDAQPLGRTWCIIITICVYAHLTSSAHRCWGFSDRSLWPGARTDLSRLSDVDEFCSCDLEATPGGLKACMPEEGLDRKEGHPRETVKGARAWVGR